MDPAQLGAILSQLLARGFETPIHLAALGVNGSVIACRYTAADEGTLDAKVIAQHIERGSFVLPINLVFVDARGEAARVVFARDGSVETMN